VSCVGDVERNSKPVIGMAFDTLEDVENFYRDYGLWTASVKKN
jgi:hypothetical protein